MSTFDRNLLVAAIAVCALSVPAAAGAADQQTEDAAASERSLNEIRALNQIEAEQRAAIEAEIALNGPLSPELYELYFSLAEHYRERDDHILAIDALEQALHIQRVAHGLFSLEQAAAARQLIDSALAVGRLERATELDVQLMRIAFQNLDDVRSAEILADTADRQIEIYERYLAGDLPPVLDINLNSGPPGSSVDSNEMLGRSSLRNARRNWSMAINVLIRAGDDENAELVRLEENLIRSYFAEKEALDRGAGRGESLFRLDHVAERGEGLFRQGRSSYRRLLRYGARTDDLDVTARAMIGLADWNLLFHRNATALRLYADAYAALRELGVSDSALARVFSPEVPVVLPAFAPNPLAQTVPPADARRAQSGYLNVKLIMSRYGRSRLKDLSFSPEPPEARLEDRIRRIVARSRFRPMLIDGEAQHTAEFEFRYYYGDADET